MNRTARFVAFGLIIACTAAVFYFSAYPSYERWRAAKFIDIVAQLKPGTTTEPQAKTALASYRPGTEQLVTSHWDIGSNRTVKATGYPYRFFDGKISSFHLLKPAELSASLFFRDGVLALKTVSLHTGSGTCCFVLVKEANRDFDDGPKNGGSISVDRRGNPTSEIIVSIRHVAGLERAGRARSVRKAGQSAVSESLQLRLE